MPSKTDYITYSIILAIFPLGLLGLMFLQLVVDRYFRNASSSNQTISDRDKRTTVLIYAVYISGLGCALVGYALHISNDVLWCEKFGLLPCFALLGLSKVFLYLFFLRRARLAQGFILSKCLHIFFTYIATTYLFIYWMIYCVLSAIVFTGQFSHDAISNCNILGSWAAGFSTFAGFVELFNSIASVALFSYPLIRALHQVKLLGGAAIDPSDRLIRLQFISVMKWNVALTAIASLSSVTNLFMLLVAGHYIWLFCLGDPFINALCTFFMIAPNREYFAMRCCGKTGADNAISGGSKPTIIVPNASNTSKTETSKAYETSQKVNHENAGDPDPNKIGVTIHNETR